MNYENTYEASYFFVPFPVRKQYTCSNEKLYSGTMELRIKCITDIHIGSGYRDFIGTNVLVQETMKMDGKPVIPGSSLKGAVRNLARAVSSSCTPKNTKECSVKNGNINLCITCDIFGAMGRASKVSFLDFTADENVKTKKRSLNTQFGPHIGDKGSEGYKFYKTVPNKYDTTSKSDAEVICEGSTFTGKIFFSNLTEEELSLLGYALTLNSDRKHGINLKIGGFKNEGMGEIKAELIDFKVNNGLSKNIGDLAAGYYKRSTAFKENFEDIEDGLWDGVE